MTVPEIRFPPLIFPPPPEPEAPPPPPSEGRPLQNTVVVLGCAEGGRTGAAFAACLVNLVAPAQTTAVAALLCVARESMVMGLAQCVVAAVAPDQIQSGLPQVALDCIAAGWEGVELA